MKKYILPFMSIAMLMAISSCSSSDDEVAENSAEGKLVQMTFTATQEPNVGTRTALDNKNVIWKEGDKISVFDGVGTNYNHEFSLSSGNGSTTGSFTGKAGITSGDYYAVYPYTVGAYKDPYGKFVDGISLPSKQTAYKDSFDPNAALMIAKSSDKNTFNFLNVVSLVKVTTEFACKSIVLNANEDIAGTGNLGWDETNPSISFTSNISKSIVLKPQEGQDEIAAGTYYIAVKPGELTSGWSISFTSTDYNVYTREARSEVTFNRGKIRSIGIFSIGGTWTRTSRGSNVQANQEVDLGLTITKEDGKKYRVIFANANLTTSGLALSESDYGDYYAWGATEPWYSSISGTNISWKELYSDGYILENAPFYDSANSTYTEYTNENDVLLPEHDAARQKLGGDWQIPTKEIWDALKEGTTAQYFGSGNIGMSFTSKTNSKAIFLPCSGNFSYKEYVNKNTWGLYWSSTSYTDSNSYLLTIYSNGVNKKPDGTSYDYDSKFYGFSIRPVRLVEVDN